MALIERRERVLARMNSWLCVAGPCCGREQSHVQISAVRKALGVSAIATVAGRGYRFALPVEEIGLASRAAPAPHNLPAERSSFIGREPQITTLRRLLAEHRLVMLTGIGGAGKTRLALRVAALELPRFRNGVFFIDLAPVSDRALSCRRRRRPAAWPQATRRRARRYR